MRTKLAWALLALAGALTLVALGGAAVAGLSIRDTVNGYVLTNVAIGAGFAVCGAILSAHRPANPIGWLCLAGGLAPLVTAALTPVGYWGHLHGWPAWLLRAIVTAFVVPWPLGVGLFFPLVVQLFPTGAPLSSRWRPVLWFTVAAGILFTVAMSADPGPVDPFGAGIRSFAGLPFYRDLDPLWTVANALPLVAYITAIVGLIARFNRGDDRLRRQLLWLVLAALAGVVLNAQRWVLGDGPILLLLAIPLIPVAVTIAILRYQLLDIRLALSRTVAYLLLTAGVVGAYLGLVALFGALARGTGAPVLATLLIALAFNPARNWLQRRVDRLLYGDRADPVRAVSRVGARLAGDDLAGVLDGTRQALRLPFAALRHLGRELAAAGEPPPSLHTVPLVFRGDRVGELVVGIRPGERALGGADHAVLDLLAGPLAAALHASALAEEVQASRERIVATREEERRRLHRDLHDGLGPTLTGAGFKADAAHNLVDTAPDRAVELLAELRVDISDAIDEVRRLVYGLRPPALAELGLAGALRRHCDSLPLAVDVDAPDALPPLPAAVEVAAYRIATEALTNVVRHAPSAGSARVELTVDSAVRLSIVDDGRPDGPWVPGVGLTSIRERVAELGGTYTAGPGPTGGRVTVALPLGVAE